MPGNTNANYLRQLFSPGADILYGIDKTEGRLYEYRYDNSTNTWALPRTAQNLGWTSIRSTSTSTVPDSCTLRHDPPVTRPPVAAPNHERAQMLLNPSTGKLEIVYVSDDGVLRRGYQSAPGSEVVEWQAMSGGDSHTGHASAALRADGKLVLAAHDRNADIRTYTQATPGSTTWSNPVQHGGAMLSAPVLVKGAGDLLTAFAVAADGKLWYASQTTTAEDLAPWHQASTTDNYTMSADFSVLPAAGGAFEIVFRDNTNTVQARKFTNGTLHPARVAGGLTTAGIPAEVLFADGKVHIVARGTDNNLYTQKEGTNGFSTWRLIPGLTVKGSPSMIINPHGIVEIAIRGNDDIVYRTGQTTPGSTTWRTWETNLDKRSPTQP